MRKEPLSSLCDVRNGYAFKSNDYVSSGYRVIRITNVQKGFVVDDDPKFIPNAIADKTSDFKLKLGDILISLTGNVGRIGRIQASHLPAVLNQRVGLIRPVSEDINDKFLFQYLNSDYFEGEAIKNSNGVAQLNLSSKWIGSHLIPLPPLDDQIRIAHLLGKVEGLIARRKQHLQQLDDLLKSIFLEMFGDIRAQKSSHPWKALRPYLKANSGKSSKNVIADEETGIPIFGGNGINGWAVETLYETPVIVAGRVGQQCGVIHVSKGPCWVTDNAIVLSIVDDERLNIVYLAKAFYYAPIRERVKQLDLPFINQSMLLDYPLPLPPIELQDQFAAIVEKIEGVKTRYQQSLTDLESLYGALSQKAFKGKLDLSRVTLSVEVTTEDTESREVEGHEIHERHDTQMGVAV